MSDPELVWAPAIVEKDYDVNSGLLLVRVEENKERREILVGDDPPPLRNPDILVGENDLTAMSYLHEPAVLHNLSVRFTRNRLIYTYCGIVLVAVNPYDRVDIYGAEAVGMYRGKAIGELDPHIYAVAEEAFAKMER